MREAAHVFRTARVVHLPIIATLMRAHANLGLSPVINCSLPDFGHPILWLLGGTAGRNWQRGDDCWSFEGSAGGTGKAGCGSSRATHPSHHSGADACKPFLRRTGRSALSQALGIAADRAAFFLRRLFAHALNRDTTTKSWCDCFWRQRGRSEGRGRKWGRGASGGGT